MPTAALELGDVGAGSSSLSSEAGLAALATGLGEVLSFDGLTLLGDDEGEAFAVGALEEDGAGLGSEAGDDDG